MLTDDQRERYARHLALDEVGESGQEKLLSSRVLVIGTGGLGSAVSYCQRIVSQKPAGE